MRLGNFQQLENVRKLILNFDYDVRSNSIIEKFNLSTIPSNLSYLKLHFPAENYVGELQTLASRELYLDLGEVKEELYSYAKRNIGGLTNLTKLTLAISAKNFFHVLLEIRNFPFGLLKELAFEFMDVSQSLILIIIPHNFLLTFIRLSLFSIENEPDLYEYCTNPGVTLGLGPVEHEVNIIVPDKEKLSSSVKNCTITVSQGELLKFVDLDMTKEYTTKVFGNKKPNHYL
ncbi:unnamed protein product [Ambrosiozyma monospora]|uniref:Unnamed protein product n=1 Tax=Ambrosiozyma monospora TaxID=43982 RepID=A0ACB5SXS7_AMBMO|nr:unnamed protein product [Ambrosiozyma monospora]